MIHLIVFQDYPVVLVALLLVELILCQIIFRLNFLIINKSMQQSMNWNLTHLNTSDIQISGANRQLQSLT